MSSTNANGLTVRTKFSRVKKWEKVLHVAVGSQRKASSKVQRTLCVDLVGKRRTKSPCYAIGKACDNHCSSYSCGNSYGKKEESKKDFPSRKRKMVSSPPSLKRTRTSKVLGEQGFEINWGNGLLLKPVFLKLWSLFSVPRMSYQPIKI